MKKLNDNLDELNYLKRYVIKSNRFEWYLCFDGKDFGFKKVDNVVYIFMNGLSKKLEQNCGILIFPTKDKAKITLQKLMKEKKLSKYFDKSTCSIQEIYEYIT